MMKSPEARKNIHEGSDGGRGWNKKTLENLRASRYCNNTVLFRKSEELGMKSDGNLRNLQQCIDIKRFGQRMDVT